MGVPLHQVDAFASAPFTGNPAAVCVLDDPAGADWMQAVAAEMNLSETAFVRPTGPPNRFELRWFTPTVEAELCAHATLATAHVLWDTGRLDSATPARFTTRGGALTATRRRDGAIELDFPADPVRPSEPDARLLSALGAAPVAVATGGIGSFLELPDEQAVRELEPDFRALAEFGGAVVTARADDPAFDFVSRFFAPGWGIDEDPVTGSSHCALAPYWAERFGREELVGYQASERGGVIGVRLDGSRVQLRGEAVTVLRGELTG